MAVDFYLDPLTGDIAIPNNTMRLTQNIEESSLQQVQIYLRLYRGEWQFNLVAGVPYLANDNNKIQLLGKTSKDLFDIYIKDAILERENITSIEQYESFQDLQTREVTVSFRARTNSGEVISITAPLIV